MDAATIERFERFIQPEPNSGCWIWCGHPWNGADSVREPGYGRFRHDGKCYQAHRVAYELYVAQIPAGLVIDHLCGIKHCVNPDHLRATDSVTNSRDGQKWRGCKIRNPNFAKRELFSQAS
jgi:hypothetical protein